MKSKDDFRDFIEETALAVMQARQKAIEEGIEANAVILNSKFAKTGNLYIKTSELGVSHLPPMLCGLRVEFAELPEKFAFVLTKVPRKTVEEMEAEVRAKTAREIVQRLAKVEIIGEVRGELTFVVLRKNVEKILAELGLEVDGQ